MKRKIIALLLCVCTLIPFICLYASGAETSKLGDDYRDLRGRPMEASNGERYFSKFNDYINVEQYVAYAGTPGYTDFNIVGMDEYIELHNYGGYSISLVFYCYNPQKNEVAQNSGSPNQELCGEIEFINNGELQSYDLTLGSLMPTGNSSDNGMFMILFVNIYNGDHRLGDNIDLNKRIYDIHSLSINIFDEPHYIEFTVNRRYIFTGFNADKKMSTKIFDFYDYTSPASDILSFNKAVYSRVNDVYADYPADPLGELSVAYMYENYYGTEDFELYLYLHNPVKEFISNSIVVYMFFDGKYRPYDFSFISKDSTLIKFKMDKPSSIIDYLDDDPVRDYYVGKIVSNFFDMFEVSSHFEFSEYDLSQFDPKKMKYTYSLFIPMSFVNGDSYVISNLEGLDERCNITSIGNIENIKYVEDGVVSFDTTPLPTGVMGPFLNSITFEFYMDYPYMDMLKTDFYLHNTTNEKKYSIAELPEFKFVYEGFEQSKDEPITTFSENEEDNERKPLYLRANQETTIKISAAPTYYRLDSSVKGMNYYQTLSSVYFALPVEYLTLNDDNVYNDRYVRSLEIAYSSAMATMGIASTKENFYDTIITKKNKEAKYDDVYYIGFLSGQSWIGDVTKYDYEFGNRYSNHGLPQGDTFLKSIMYGVQVDEYKNFEEVISSEELTKLYKEIRSFETALKPYQYVINFDDKKSLHSYNELSFGEMFLNYGFWHAFCYKFLGTENKADSIENINSIVTLTPSELQEAIILNDEDFSNKYFVAPADVNSVKQRMTSALIRNEAFVLVRFDVFDFYAANVHNPDGNVGSTFGFKSKYYEGIEILSIECSSEFNSKVYYVHMDPIDFAPAVTTPDPPKFKNPVSDYWSAFLSVLAIVGIAILIVIFHEPIFSFIKFVWSGIKSFFKWFFGLFKRKNKTKNE